MKSGFHFIFTRKIALYLLAGLVVSNVLFYFLVSRPLGDSYVQALHVLKFTSENAARYSFQANAFLAILVAGLIFVASLLMSHRISGPVYRFERCAETLAKGDVTVAVRLREKDEMKPVAEEFNRTTDTLREKLGEFEVLAGELAEAAAGLAAGRHGEDGPDERAMQDVADAAKRARLLREKLSFFKT